MAVATNVGGDLNYIENCIIDIPGYDTIKLRILPEISDTKRASYSDTVVIGRSSPIKTYSHSDNRVVSMKLHFIVLKEEDIIKNYKDLWAIESAVYPREGGGENGGPYKPPVVCTIKCGVALGTNPLNVVLESYQVSLPTNVAWDDKTLLPYYFEVTTSWHVVYDTIGTDTRLPNQGRILQKGS